MPSGTPPEETSKDTTDDFFLCHPGKDGERPIVETGIEALKMLPPGTEIIEFRLIETAPGLVEFFPMRRKVEDCLKGTFTLGDWFNRQK